MKLKIEANDVVNEENKPKKRKYTPRQKVDRSKSEDLDRFSISFTEASSGSECRAVLKSRFELMVAHLFQLKNITLVIKQDYSVKIVQVSSFTIINVKI